MYIILGLNSHFHNLRLYHVYCDFVQDSKKHMTLFCKFCKITLCKC